jgi:hypothetical protein
MGNNIRQLQKNKKFRNILKSQKIAWRLFARCHQFGLQDENGKIAVCMGKYNGIYDYFICFGKFESISEHELKLIDIEA